jgi:Ser/Thr protein kinase RdoA (MazF antagonist)
MITNDKQEIDEYYDFAKKALGEYKIDYDDLTFLQQSENVTFCIKRKDSEEKYLVRIHKSIRVEDDYQYNKDLIHSELLLLKELNSSGLFTVQEPVENRCGSLVTQRYNESLQQDLNVTVLKWIEGEIIDINDEQYNGLAFQLGEEVAKNHKYLRQWKIPKEFIRTEYDLESSKTNLLKLNNLVELGILSEEKFKDIYKNTMSIIEFIGQNLSRKEDWGLIHSDLNEGNYVVNEKGISFIDFSRCGYGYYLYDIAQTLMHLNVENRKLFVKGYEANFFLPSDFEKLLEGFFVISIIENMLFLASNHEEYDHIEKMANYLCDYVIQKYKTDKRFILGSR